MDTSEMDVVSAWPVVVVRAADAGATYLSWTWLDNPSTRRAVKLDGASVAAATAALDRALMAPVQLSSDGSDPADYESKADAAQRALSRGAFACVDRERHLARLLTEALLPSELRAQILDRAGEFSKVHLRITPSPRLARVPWELLFADPCHRLLEVAMITLDPPTTVHGARTALPEQWANTRHRPPLHILDPALPPRAAEHGLGRTLAGLAKNALVQGISGEADSSSGGRHGGTNTARALSRIDLSRELQIPRSRLFYFGHVSSTTAEPGSASIHLYDNARTSSSDAGQWGMAEPLRPRTRFGTVAEAQPGDHLPLSALDFLLGTQQCNDSAVWGQYSSIRPQRGHEIWPMPPRVALIACEGGVDFRSSETFGLVVAMVDSGASLVTTTRWTLPTDNAFHTIAGLRKSVHPTVDLALIVDRAHTQRDPLRLMHEWQCAQLAKWESGSGGLACSPIVWAALTHTIAEARSDSSA